MPSSTAASRSVVNIVVTYPYRRYLVGIQSRRAVVRCEELYGPEQTGEEMEKQYVG